MLSSDVAILGDPPRDANSAIRLDMFFQALFSSNARRSRRLRVRVVAVIAIRNERSYLANCLEHLIGQGVDYAVIDNDSNDGSIDILKKSRFARHLTAFETLPYTGTFDLTAQLEAKDRMYRRLDADWLMHVDADEEMISYRPRERLVDGFARVAEAEGADAVNFDEFVFLPVDYAYVPDCEGPQPMRHYYFFEPSPRRLVRAWRADLPLSGASSGGHRLSGANFRLAQENFGMRHYIFRDQSHALKKYTQRTFSQQDCAKGWHGNRIGIDEDKYRFPPAGRLQKLDQPGCKNLKRNRRKKMHYWDWPHKRPIWTVGMQAMRKFYGGMTKGGSG